MNERSLRLRVVTPACELQIEQVVHLRFDAADGARGVLGGHERATAYLREGAVHVRARVGEAQQQLRELFIATEGGIAVIGPRQVVLVSAWAELAEDLHCLAEHVRARATRRSRIDAEARTLGRRSELALRRALAELEREVSW